MKSISDNIDIFVYIDKITYNLKVVLLLHLEVSPSPRIGQFRNRQCPTSRDPPIPSIMHFNHLCMGSGDERVGVSWNESFSTWDFGKRPWQPESVTIQDNQFWKRQRPHPVPELHYVKHFNHLCSGARFQNCQAVAFSGYCPDLRFSSLMPAVLIHDLNIYRAYTK